MDRCENAKAAVAIVLRGVPRAEADVGRWQKLAAKFHDQLEKWER